MSFVQWVVRMGDVPSLKSLSPLLLQGLLKFINEQTEVVSSNGIYLSLIVQNNDSDLFL